MFKRFPLVVFGYAVMALLGVCMGVCIIIESIASVVQWMFETIHDTCADLMDDVCHWDKENHQ